MKKLILLTVIAVMMTVSSYAQSQVSMDYTSLQQRITLSDKNGIYFDSLIASKLEVTINDDWIYLNTIRGMLLNDFDIVRESPEEIVLYAYDFINKHKYRVTIWPDKKAMFLVTTDGEMSVYHYMIEGQF